MKKKIILCMLVLFSCFSVFSQTIDLRLQTRTGREPINGTLNFVIDKVDTTVLGFAVSDKDGYCRIILTKEPKGHIVNVKIFGMGYGVVDVEGVYWSSEKRTIVDLNLGPQEMGTKLFTVMVNDSKTEMSRPDPLLDSIPWSYYKSYMDTALYYYRN
jgi:hypothetical protein